MDGNVASFGDNEIVGTADLSSLAAPKLSKVIPFAPGALATTTNGNTFFAAGDGLTTLDLTRASDVTLIPRSSTDWIANSAVVGSITYVARLFTGLALKRDDEIDVLRLVGRWRVEGRGAPAREHRRVPSPIQRGAHRERHLGEARGGGDHLSPGLPARLGRRRRAAGIDCNATSSRPSFHSSASSSA